MTPQLPRSRLSSLLSSIYRSGFAHGIHPQELKERTRGLRSQRMPFVARYVLPVRQHLGAPSQPVVEVGQPVGRGEVIAEPGAFVSTALHAPVTGWVRAIDRRRFADGRFDQAIEIEADPEVARGRVFVFVEDDWGEQSFEIVAEDDA